MKKKLRMPAALIMSMMLFLALAVPVSAASAPKIEDVDYDHSDREVEFDFIGKVQWKNPTVTITRNGNNYAKYIISKDSDDLEVKVKKLSQGKKYSYKITGVKKKGTKGYKTVTGTFYAYDD